MTLVFNRSAADRTAGEPYLKYIFRPSIRRIEIATTLVGAPEVDLRKAVLEYIHKASAFAKSPTRKLYKKSEPILQSSDEQITVNPKHTPEEMREDFFLHSVQFPTPFSRLMQAKYNSVETDVILPDLPVMSGMLRYAYHGGELLDPRMTSPVAVVMSMPKTERKFDVNPCLSTKQPMPPAETYQEFRDNWFLADEAWTKGPLAGAPPLQVSYSGSGIMKQRFSRLFGEIHSMVSRIGIGQSSVGSLPADLIQAARISETITEDFIQADMQAFANAVTNKFCGLCVPDKSPYKLCNLLKIYSAVHTFRAFLFYFLSVSVAITDVTVFSGRLRKNVYSMAVYTIEKIFEKMRHNLGAVMFHTAAASMDIAFTAVMKYPVMSDLEDALWATNRFRLHHGAYGAEYDFGMLSLVDDGASFYPKMDNDGSGLVRVKELSVVAGFVSATYGEAAFKDNVLSDIYSKSAVTDFLITAKSRLNGRGLEKAAEECLRMFPVALHLEDVTDLYRRFYDEFSRYSAMYTAKEKAGAYLDSAVNGNKQQHILPAFSSFSQGLLSGEDLTSSTKAYGYGGKFPGEYVQFTDSFNAKRINVADVYGTSGVRWSDVILTSERQLRMSGELTDKSSLFEMLPDKLRRSSTFSPDRAIARLLNICMESIFGVSNIDLSKFNNLTTPVALMAAAVHRLAERKNAFRRLDNQGNFLFDIQDKLKGAAFTDPVAHVEDVFTLLKLRATRYLCPLFMKAANSYVFDHVERAVGFAIEDTTYSSIRYDHDKYAGPQHQYLERHINYAAPWFVAAFHFVPRHFRKMCSAFYPSYREKILEAVITHMLTMCENSVRSSARRKGPFECDSSNWFHSNGDRVYSEEFKDKIVAAFLKEIAPEMVTFMQEMIVATGKTRGCGKVFMHKCISRLTQFQRYFL